MANTGRGLHIDQLLTNMAIGYRPAGMIADMVFPMIQVQKQSDRYLVFDKADNLRLENDKRSPNKEANIIEQSISHDPYYCQNYALKTALVIEDRANADPAFLQALINNKGTFLLDKLILNWEKRITDIVLQTANVGADASPVIKWGNLTNSVPMEDIWAAIFDRDDTTGVIPNRMIMGESAWRNFRRNAGVRDLINGVDNGGGNVSMAQVQSLFGLESFLVGKGFYNTANEGQAPSYDRLWTDSVLIYYAPSAPTMEVPSYGYSFRWAAPGLANMSAERHPFDSRKKSEEIEIGYYQDEKVTAKEYSYLLTSVN